MHIPVDGRFNDEPNDFKRLFEIVRDALDSSGDVTFDLRRCTWLSTNAVALLGGAARAVQAESREATFEWPQNEQVHKFLGKCDFRRGFGGGDHPWLDNSVPFRHNPEFDQQNLVTYLSRYWLGRGWLDVSDDLRMQSSVR
jgi:hypothetical protein